MQVFHVVIIKELPYNFKQFIGKANPERQAKGYPVTFYRYSTFLTVNAHLLYYKLLLSGGRT